MSRKSLEILRQIGSGKSYAQIVESGSTVTYLDIFCAAHEALALHEAFLRCTHPSREATKPTATERLAAIKELHPRAYSPWSEAEDRELLDLLSRGVSPKAIAQKLQRQQSAIQSRISKLTD